jgi:hypothetical protein
MRFATWESAGRTRSGVVSGTGLHPLPGGRTVLDLVRAGLPAALEAGERALRAPAVPWEERRWSSRRSLSFSLSESSTEDFLTPAACSCSSSVPAGLLSSAANWATVVTAMWGSFKLLSVRRGVWSIRR